MPPELVVVLTPVFKRPADEGTQGLPRRALGRNQAGYGRRLPGVTKSRLLRFRSGPGREGRL
jgi:hypothetical protein